MYNTLFTTQATRHKGMQYVSAGGEEITSQCDRQRLKITPCCYILNRARGGQVVSGAALMPSERGTEGKHWD